VLQLAFTRSDHRMQRKSDGTVMIEGRRFELPNRYWHVQTAGALPPPYLPKPAVPRLPRSQAPKKT
jgi:hypothetical protein